MRLVAALLSTVLLSPVVVGQDLPPSYPPPAERESYYLSIHPADSSAFSSPYPNPEVRDSIDAHYEDHFEAARVIERHMMAEQTISFLEPIQRGDPRWAEHSKRWKIALLNGDTTWTNPNPLDMQFAHFMFEYFYAAHQLFCLGCSTGSRSASRSFRERADRFTEHSVRRFFHRRISGLPRFMMTAWPGGLPMAYRCSGLENRA